MMRQEIPESTHWRAIHLSGIAHVARIALRALRSRASDLALVTGIALLTSCSPPERPPETAVVASGSDLESGNPLVTIHPLSRQIQRHALFVTLVALDSALLPIPYYARSWRWNDSKRSITFVLDSTLKWHDGVRTTASDVRFTIEAAGNPELGSPRAGDLSMVDSVRTRGSDTVSVFFSHEQSRMPIVFAELPLVPRHILDSVPLARWRAHAFSTAPVGNGPFRFVNRSAGRRWRFERNSNFPAALGGPPSLRSLVVAVVDESATKFAGLVSGELDLAGVSPTMAHLVNEDPTLELMSPPVLFSTAMAFNTTRPPFDDARVRRAVSLSIDRVRIVATAVAGFGTPASGAIPPGIPAYREGRATHDGAEADRLFDDAGWRRGPGDIRSREGRKLEIELLTVGSGDLAVEQLVQADLAERGVAVKIRVAELATFLALVRSSSKDFDVALTGVPGDLSLGYLSALFATSQRGGALDYTGFHCVALDSLLSLARSSPNSTAGDAWSRVNNLLIDSMPVAWLYHARGVQGRSRLLLGVQMDLRGELVTVSRWSRASSR